LKRIKEKTKMVQKLRMRMAKDEAGFTLVELLVVMLILGLLAAIAIPSFFNQRDKAKDADAKEAARTAQTAMETYATDHDGSYVGATADDLVAIEPSLGNATLADPTDLTDDTFTVETTSETDNTFSISRLANGILDSDCQTPEEAGCPSDGNWAADGD
jgi:type IV pilus assembly protein PilA